MSNVEKRVRERERAKKKELSVLYFCMRELCAYCVCLFVCI